MSNLDAAKSAIEAEIAYTKQGLEYYQSRIQVLMQALKQLDDVGAPTVAPIGMLTKVLGKKYVAGAAPAGKRGRKPGKKQRNTDNQELPSTRGDYWFNLVSDEPQSAANILKAAVNSLGFDPTPEQVQKLRQRVTPALVALLQTKRIQDMGTGRERRFFK